jgi:hypothetical protein
MPDRLEQMAETFAPLNWMQRDVARAWMLKSLSEQCSEEQWQRALKESMEAAAPRAAKPAPSMDRKTASTGETDK